MVSLGVVLSTEHWDWLQGGTGPTNNAATVRNIALVVGGIVAILTALWRSLVAERQATAATRQAEIGERTYLNESYRQAASMLGDGAVRFGCVRWAESSLSNVLAEDHPDEVPARNLQTSSRICPNADGTTATATQRLGWLAPNRKACHTAGMSKQRST